MLKLKVIYDIVAIQVVKRYLEYYDDEINGCAEQIASEIASKIGGKITLGCIEYAGGSHKRNHVWVERGDQIIDPMLTQMFTSQDRPEHVKWNQDARLITEAINRTEMYHVPDPHVVHVNGDHLKHCLSYTVDYLINNESEKQKAHRVSGCTCGDYFTTLICDSAYIYLGIWHNTKLVAFTAWHTFAKKFVDSEENVDYPHQKDAEECIISFVLLSAMLA